MTKKTFQPFRVKPGVCRCCLGDGGYTVLDVVDDDTGRYYPQQWVVCPSCEGSGKDEIKYANKSNTK